MTKPVTAPALPQLLTIREVAHQQNVSPRTIRRQIENGDLACYRIGRAIRISPEDLSTFLKKLKR